MEGDGKKLVRIVDTGKTVPDGGIPAKKYEKALVFFGKTLTDGKNGNSIKKYISIAPVGKATTGIRIAAAEPWRHGEMV